MGLRKIKVKPFSSTYYQVKKLYLEAFPAEERLPFLPLVLNSWRRQADFFAYYDEEEFIGLAYLIANEDLCFLLFLAVDADYQSKGYGSCILADIKAHAGGHPMILTIEPMDEGAANYAQRLKRLDFYIRNGFILTNHFYQEGKEKYQIMLTDEQLDLISFKNLMKTSFLGLVKVDIN